MLCNEMLMLDSLCPKFWFIRRQIKVFKTIKSRTIWTTFFPSPMHCNGVDRNSSGWMLDRLITLKTYNYFHQYSNILPTAVSAHCNPVVKSAIQHPLKFSLKKWVAPLSFNFRIEAKFHWNLKAHSNFETYSKYWKLTQILHESDGWGLEAIQLWC